MSTNRTMFRCIGVDGKDSMWLSDKEIKNIIPVKDKDGNPYLMVNYYDLDYCINSTKFFERIEIKIFED